MTRLPLLFALIAMVVLLGIGDIMNNACKTSWHAWCAPDSERQTVVRHQKGDALVDHATSLVRSSFAE